MAALHSILAITLASLCMSAPTRLMIDQSGLFTAATVNGFNVSYLYDLGVRQVAGGGIDCTSYLTGVPGGPWFNASGLSYIASQINETRAALAVAKAAGLQVFMASDIFQFPVAMMAKYAANLTSPGVHCSGYNVGPSCISIASNFTQFALRALWDELQATFPTLDGVVLRYGENSPCYDHQGNVPMDTTSTATMISSLTALLSFLREELCVKRNLTVIFRTWDTSTSLFHANATFYSAVVDAVPPHDKLVFSIKHTQLDFWRRVRPNECRGVGNHSQVVEVEVGGMYGGCGSWPLYVGNSVINYYEEDAANGLPYGLTWDATNNTRTFAGVLTNHQCTDLPHVPDPWLWWRLEEAVVAGWSRNTTASEAELFDAYVQNSLGVTDVAARTAFRNLSITAMSANLAIQTCEVFDVLLQEVDRPTANWMLWNGWGGLEVLANNTCHAANVSHCEVFPWLYNNSKFDVALAEKEWAYTTYQALNASAATIAPHFSNETVATAFLASVESGMYAAGIVSAGWTAMAEGYSGDRRGGVYNCSALTAAITQYDTLWVGYLDLPSRYPPALVPGTFNDTYWQHPNSGVPGMRQSVDKYRSVC